MPLLPQDPELAEIHAIARDLARRAGAIQRERYETGLTIDTKSATIDLVTEVDRACEALIVAGLDETRPQDSILAEEGHGAERVSPDAPYRWVIDPLDGTTNFAHGFPRFCVSIGVERIRQGSPPNERVVGIVFDPLLDECFEAVLGEGAWLGDRQLQVSVEAEIGRSLVATGFAYDVHRSDDDNLESFNNVVKTARGIRRDGSAALDLCYVAAGRLEAYWELKLHPWDVAAGYLIVEEAGGRVTDFGGGPPDPSGREVLCSNGRVHAELAAQLVPGKG
jgi:myo-inositol-1(or 4)-monophosphatase